MFVTKRTIFKAINLKSIAKNGFCKGRECAGRNNGKQQKTPCRRRRGRAAENLDVDLSENTGDQVHRATRKRGLFPLMAASSCAWCFVLPRQSARLTFANPYSVLHKPAKVNGRSYFFRRRTAFTVFGRYLRRARGCGTACSCGKITREASRAEWYRRCVAFWKSLSLAV